MCAMRLLLTLLLLFPLALHAADTLDIYWIDVEGGAATLIVTPGGDTVLMDAGWPGYENRDAKRIQHVLTREAKAGEDRLLHHVALSRRSRWWRAATR